MHAASPIIDARPDTMTSPTGFAEIYDQYYATVYRAACRVTGNPADAEDALQTVFLRVLNQGNRLDPAGMSEAYFRRAAVNAAVDLLRRRISRAEAPFNEDASAAATDSPELLKMRLRRAIATLDESDAVMFLLRYVEGLSNGEIAGMFGLEKNNVAVRLHRIRQTLQIEMER